MIWLNLNLKTQFSIKYIKTNLILILSEVLPYCSMLKLNTNCFEYANRKMFFFDGIKNTYLPYEYLNKVIEIFEKKKKV